MKNRSGLLPTYIVSTLGDLILAVLLTGCMIYGIQLGGTKAQTGLIGSGYGMTYLIMPAILGRVGDKIPRKISLILASVLQIGLGLYFLFVASSVIQLFIGQLLMGIAFAFFWQSIEAYISENTHNTEEEHQRGMANFCIWWSIGFMTGPLIAGISSDFDVKFMFVIVLISSIIIFLLVLFGLPSLKEEKKSIRRHENKDAKKNLLNDTLKMENLIEDIDERKKENKNEYKKSNKILMKVLFGMIIFAVVSRMILTYFTDYAVRKDTLDWTGTITGEVIFLFGVGRTIYFLFGRFYKAKIFKSSFSKINKSFLVLGVLLILIIFIKDPILMSLLFTGIGFFIGLIYLSSLDLLIVNEQKSKGAKAGLFESSIGFGGMITPIIAGALGEINAILPFLVFAAFIFFMFLLVNIKRS